MKHPFTHEAISIDCLDNVSIADYFKITTACRKVQSKWTPRLNPTYPRFIHIDLALTGDSVGIAMGHTSGIVQHKKINDYGIIEEKKDPFIIIDFMLRIKPPSGSEIDFSKIRAFVLYLQKCGYQIDKVSFDDWQSRDSRQILEKNGFATATVSMDRSDSQYKVLRGAFFDRRIGVYKYEPFIGEVLDLEYDSQAHKVDHPIKASSANNGLNGKGAKDVADAVCGVVWACTTEEYAHETVPLLALNDVDEETHSRVIDPTVENLQPYEDARGAKKRIAGQTVDFNKLRDSINDY